MESIRSEPETLHVPANADDVDRLRDDPTDVGRGRWLAFLVVVVAIALLVTLAILV